MIVCPAHEKREGTLDRPIVWLEEVGREDVARVGGKNASLGEMIRALGQAGVRVPPGFATTAAAYRAHLSAHALPKRIGALLNVTTAAAARFPTRGQPSDG